MEELPKKAEYQSTMQRLERAKRTSSRGTEFWMAREIQELLGYEGWRNFVGVVERAATSLTSTGVTPSHHIVETNTMMGVGNSAQRRVADYFLSRAACYLIAMNGDPAKPEVAAAQAYFAVTARAKEVDDEMEKDEKRLELRDKVTDSFKAVSSAAYNAGVPTPKLGVFHDARYQGLYGASRREVMRGKGLGDKDNPFDRMGALELSANDFQMNLAAETMRSERVTGEAAAIRKNKEVAQRVRKTMIDSGSLPPEQLPVAEPIKNVRKRVAAKTNQSKLSKDSSE
jgi:DNA-damage-inducible protein D